MTIKRYEPDVDYIGTGDYAVEMAECDGGDYVTYDDHRAAIDAERARADVAESSLAFERVTIAELRQEAHQVRVNMHLAREERDTERARAERAEAERNDHRATIKEIGRAADALRAEVERLTNALSLTVPPYETCRQLEGEIARLGTVIDRERVMYRQSQGRVRELLSDLARVEKERADWQRAAQAQERACKQVCEERDAVAAALSRIRAAAERVMWAQSACKPWPPEIVALDAALRDEEVGDGDV